MAKKKAIEIGSCKEDENFFLALSKLIQKDDKAEIYPINKDVLLSLGYGSNEIDKIINHAFSGNLDSQIRFTANKEESYSMDLISASILQPKERSIDLVASSTLKNMVKYSFDFSLEQEERNLEVMTKIVKMIS